MLDSIGFYYIPGVTEILAMFFSDVCMLLNVVCPTIVFYDGFDPSENPSEVAVKYIPETNTLYICSDFITEEHLDAMQYETARELTKMCLYQKDKTGLEKYPESEFKDVADLDRIANAFATVMMTFFHRKDSWYWDRHDFAEFNDTMWDDFPDAVKQAKAEVAKLIAACSVPFDFDYGAFDDSDGFCDDDFIDRYFDEDDEDDGYYKDDEPSFEGYDD